MVLNTLKQEIKEEYLTDVVEKEFLGFRDVHRIDEFDCEKTHWVGLFFKVLVDVEKVGNGEPHKFDEIGWFRFDGKESRDGRRGLPSPLHSQIEEDLKEFGDKL